jgi:type I restriction enzyme, S subunit
LEISFLPMPAVEEETGRYFLSETRKLGEVRKGYTGFIEGDMIFAKITPCMENGKVTLLEKLVNGIGFGSTELISSRKIR